MENSTRYLSAAQVRSRLGGISSTTLWRWIKDADLAFPKPAFLVNKRRLFSESAIDAWAANRGADQLVASGEQPKVAA